jgi:hypothetical protein
MTYKYFTYIVLLFFINVFIDATHSGLRAQDYSVGNPAKLFSSHEILQLTIKGDYKTILKDIGDDRDEHPASLEYIENGDTIRLDINISTRGNFRRKASNCNFPPLRLNFKKKQVENTLFEGIDKIKLVTHCKSKSEKFEQYAIDEYLVYRVYNIITDTSFRVRMALINYLDTVTHKKTQESFAFFIETDDAFEDRMGMVESKQKYLLQENTMYHHMGVLAMFEYMIGNTDWAVSTLHNIKLFSLDSLQPPYAVPYDFDWCGAVNAFYAVPLPRFELESVQDRLFRGYCRPMEDYLEYAGHFLEKKADIYTLIENFDLLDKGEKKRLIKYYDDFYTVISDENALRMEFTKSCLQQNQIK